MEACSSTFCIPLRRYKIAQKLCLPKRTCCLCNACLFSNLLPSHLAIQHAVQYTLTSFCDLSHDEYSFMSLFSWIYFLSYPIFCIPISGTYIHFMLTCTTGFPSFLSPFLCSSCSSRPFCLSYFFLLYFICNMHWGRLSRQRSDQPEIGVAYMAFLVLCLCKKMRLRRDGTRKSRGAVIHWFDTSFLLHGHFICPMCIILSCPDAQPPTSRKAPLLPASPHTTWGLT